MYAHVDEETISLTSFASGDKVYAFLEDSMVLKDSHCLFTKQMFSFFEQFIYQGIVLENSDKILLLAQLTPKLIY